MSTAPILLPAGNASGWTGPTGNNTWLLPGQEPALVDAGVGRPEHLAAIEQALGGVPLVRVCITHAHPDHVGGLPALRERWPSLMVVYAARHNARVPAGDTTLKVIATPGHAPDHLCFFDEASGDLYCGDLLRAGGTIVIPARHGGNLKEYLASLRRVRVLQPRRLLPGHGPIVDDPVALIDEYLAHRAAREEAIVAAIHGGAQTVEDIVARVYVGLSPALREAAADSVRAHLVKLAEEERVAREWADR